MKYTYKISGLDCPKCAKKIEDTLKRHQDFKNVVVNFATLKITYETDIKNSLSVINKIIKEIDANVKIVETEENSKEYHISILITAIILGLVGYFTNFKGHEILIYLSYILLLYKPFQKAILMLIKNKTINENMLITISCIGAYLVNSVLEGMMVSSLYILGKILEEKAINKTRTSIQDLLTIKQDYANLKIGDKYKKVDVSKIKIGDIICIKKGEKVPVDGKVISGTSLLDTSALTGESSLLEVKKDSKVLSGFVNTGDIILVSVTSLFKDSMVSKILELVETASDKKARVETTVSKLSKIYTPTVLILAILVAIFLPILINITYEESIYRALTFLVIACPCAIAISIPLSYFTGIGVSSQNGILVKGSNYLDNLSHIKKIIFDKTGTLTTGSFEVEKIVIDDKNYTEEMVIDILRKGESLSNHPIAKSIMKLKDEEVNNKDVLDYAEIEGEGISFKLNSKHIKIGNERICSNCKKEVTLHLNIDSKHVASICLDDGIKKNTKEVIDELHQMKIETMMFTGDKKEIAMIISKKLGIDKYYAEMLPTDKYNMYEKIEKDLDVVAFVGDGINDSPVLKRASIGISMGGIGSDAAILASDVVIMNDDLKKIPLGIKISKYTNFIIKENLIFALSVKILILLFSIFGLSTMWFAVFADTGVTVITILNSLRVMLKFKYKSNRD